MKFLSSITDIPIEHAEQDSLKTHHYALALADFIEKADTPLTIGLQGEWGTGKTSMMYMIKEILEERVVATSWVNTWEYAMFRSAHQTTPAVLQAMLEKLKESCIQKGTWTLKDERTANVKKIGRFIGALANQVIESQTGVNVKDALSEDEKESLEIAKIKEQINSVIQDLLNDTGNKHTRVVFFVDDLDRIPPSDAVEVLEALKNMFDIPNCIYVTSLLKV
jgi:predicted KAP-like P-loop ATPase